MRRKLFYMAHPLGAPDHAGLEANLNRACRWLAWLRKTYPSVTFIAPWIAAVISGEDDSDPAQREAGLVDADAIVERCDGIVLVGGRISSGMERELGHASACVDLTYLGDEPPARPPLGALHFYQLVHAGAP